MKLNPLRLFLATLLGIPVLCSILHAQQSVKKDTAVAPFPSTDIIIVSMRDSGATFEIYGKPVNFTHRTGYDNQPSFWFDGKTILYTSIREDQQADIYSYDIASKKTIQLTKTPESEYSPTPHPGGGRFSVVRVEKDSSQCLWWYPIKGGVPKQLYVDMKKAAYHCWIDDQTMAIVALEQNNGTTLRTFDIATNKYNVVRSGVGRCIARVPKNPGYSFTEVVKDTAWLWVYDYEDNKAFRQVPMKQGSQDYAWGPHRALIMGNGSELFTCRPPLDSVWHKFADLKQYGYSGITRIAVSPAGDKLAIVVQDGAATAPEKMKARKKKK